MELLYEFEIPPNKAIVTYENTTSLQLIAVAKTAGGDEIEVKLYPGVSFHIRPIGLSSLQIFKAASQTNQPVSLECSLAPNPAVH